MIVIIIQNFKLGTEAVVISDLCQIPSSLILLPGGVLVNSVDTNIAKQGESIIYYPNIATYDIKSTEPPISFTVSVDGYLNSVYDTTFTGNTFYSTDTPYSTGASGFGRNKDNIMPNQDLDIELKYYVYGTQQGRGTESCPDALTSGNHQGMLYVNSKTRTITLESTLPYIKYCTDDDVNNDPYFKGTISFTDNQGGIGYYYDICVDSNQLTQYGCSDSQGGAELTYTTSSTNCLSGYKCYNGACIQQSCNTDADADCNGAISLTEIHSYGQKWLNSQITRTKVGQAIQAWSGG